MNPDWYRQLWVFGFAVIVAAIVAGLGSAILTLPTEATGLAREVTGKLEQAGVHNPVTAVLLNFRGYDTLLELAVMLLAVLGARALTSPASPTGAKSAPASVPVPDSVPAPGPVHGSALSNPVLHGFIRVIAPVMIVVAGYLLWVGGHAPGGAFQAAAVLATIGVLLRLGGVDWTRGLSELAERLLLVAGIVVFLVLGVGTMSAHRELLEFSPAMAKWMILGIEIVATISIAAILLALYGSGSLRQASRLPAPSERKRG